MKILRTFLLLALVVQSFSVTIPSAAAAEPGTDALRRLWERTDMPVAEGAVVRTWMWGPQAYTELFQEPYLEAPDFERDVQYFDKSRMEVTDTDGDVDDPWYVTNGLLARELISGELQFGDDAFLQLNPAEVNVAGDPDDPTGPTYRTFRGLMGRDVTAVDATYQYQVDRDGNVVEQPSLADYGVIAAEFDELTGHSIAAPFWDLMNETGLIYEDGDLIEGPLVQNPVFAVGRPVTEAYWSWVKVDDVYQDVLTQCFERRCLTYTPENDEQWKVEAGNVGQHYYRWRYESGQEFEITPVNASASEQTITLGELELFLPAGSTNGAGLVGLSKHAQIPEPQGDYEAVAAGYSLSLAGAGITDTVDVTLPYDAELIPDDVSEDQLVVGRYDEATQEWEFLSGTVENDRIKVETDTLSIWTVFASLSVDDPPSDDDPGDDPPADDPGDDPPAEDPTPGPPVATGQQIDAIAAMPVDIALSASDPDSADLTFEITSGPDHGLLDTHAPAAACTSTFGGVDCLATVTYTADAGFDGGDSFTFEVSDGSLTDSAVVSINVTSASPAESTISAEPTTLPADGVATSLVTVVLRDDDANELGTSGGTVELFTDAGALGEVADHGDGTYTATLTAPTQAAEATVIGELNGVQMDDSAVVVFVAGEATTIEVVSGDDGTDEVGASRTLTVLVTDQFGNPVADHTVDWQVDSGGGSVSSPASETNSQGHASVEWTLGTAVGVQEASAISAGLDGSPVQFAVDAVAGPPAQVVIETQPSDTAQSGSVFPVQPVTQLVDQYGNNVPEAGVTVTASIEAGDGNLSGSTSIPTDSDGQAVFTDLVIDGVTGEYTLLFEADGFSSVSSDPIDLQSGEATQLAITTQPSSSARNDETLSTQPVIQLRDSGGNEVDQAGVPVIASIDEGAGELQGTLTVETNAQGESAFADVSIVGLVGEYTLLFEAPGLDDVTSNTIHLDAGDPTQLAVTTQPSDAAQSGETLDVQPVVQLRDSAGNEVEQESVVVTASIESGDGALSPDPAEATTNADGNATFTGLVITGSVGEYVLLFDAEDLDSVVSDAITLQAGDAAQLAIATQPSVTAQAGVIFPIQPEIQVQDSAGNAVSEADITVTVEIAYGEGDLEGTLSVETNEQGLVSFSDLRIDGSVGERTLRFTSSGLIEVTSDEIDVQPGPASLELSTITADPTEVLADGESQSDITVQLVDQFGNDLTSSGGTVALSTDAGTLGQVDDHDDGTYTASLTSSEELETATITGTLDEDPLAGSATVEFVVGEPETFSVTSSSNAVLAGEDVTITAQLVDSFGRAVSMDQLTVTWSSTEGGSFAAPTSDTNESGEASVIFTTSETVGVTHIVEASATIDSEDIEGSSDGIVTEGPPEAADYGPAEDSGPGDDFHIESGGTFSLAAPGLFSDVNPGEPEATIEFFTVGETDYTPSDDPVTLDDGGSLTVRSDGSFSYTPQSDFLGVFTFDYTLSNPHGSSTGTVTIHVGEGPEASDVTYEHTIIGNVMIDTSTATPFSVTDNDQGEDLTLSLVSSPDGTVDLNQDGTFTFDPNAGVRGETSFSYEISNQLGSDTANVTINVGTVVWFIDNNPDGCEADCDGSLSSPFTSLNDFQAVNDGNEGNAHAGDVVFVYQSDEDYTSSLALLSDQRLIGQDASASLVDVAELTLSPHSVSLPETDSEGENDVILVSTGDAIQLDQNNLIHGFTVGDTGGVAIAGSGIGDLEIDDLTIDTTGQALDLADGTISATFDSISSSGGTHGIQLTDLSSGTLSVNGGTIQSSSSSGITLSNVGVDVTLNGLAVQGTGSHGIDATDVGSLSLIDVLLEGNGDSAGEHGINLGGGIGALLLDNTTIRNASEDLVHADSSSNVAITVQNGSTFEHPATKGSFTNSAFTLLPRGGAGFNVSIEDSRFTNIAVNAMEFHPQDNASGSHSVTFSNNNVTVDEAFNESCTENPECRISNLNIQGGTGSAQINLTVEENTFTRASGSGVILFRARGTTSLNARILGNQISGALAHGIDIDQHGDSQFVVEIDNNTISDVYGDGILVAGGEPQTGYSGSISVTITNNEVSGHNPDGFHAAGITVVRFGNVGQDFCLALTDNSVSEGGGQSWIFDVVIWGNLSDEFDDDSVVITYEGNGTGDVDSARVQQDNPGVNLVDVFDTVLSGGQMCERPQF